MAAITAKITSNQVNYPTNICAHDTRGTAKAATPSANTNFTPKAVERHLGGEYFANKLFSAGDPIVLATTIIAKTGKISAVFRKPAITSSGIWRIQHTR